MLGGPVQSAREDASLAAGVDGDSGDGGKHEEAGVGSVKACPATGGTLPLLLLQPASRIIGRERKSKLLNPKSALGVLVVELTSRMHAELGLRPGRRAMGPHIEVVSSREDGKGFPLDDVVNKRALAVHGVALNVCSPEAWDFVGAAFALLADVPGYPHRGHVTIVYLGGNMPRGAVRAKLLSRLRDIAVGAAAAACSAGSSL